MNGIQHIVVIPARKNSRGLPGKNRLMFPLLADFIDRCGLFDRVIVTSDDDILLATAEDRGYETRRRPAHISGDSNSIKEAFLDIAQHCGVESEDYLWLMFITLVYRNIADFRHARGIVDSKSPPGLCSFIPAKSHPFACWHVDRESERVWQYIENDCFNRQDFPKAWVNYNYLCCVKVKEIANASSNLICESCYPYLLSDDQAEQMIEVDTPADLSTWRQLHPEQFERWFEPLSAERRPPIPD